MNYRAGASKEFYASKALSKFDGLLRPGRLFLDWRRRYVAGAAPLEPPPIILRKRIVILINAFVPEIRQRSKLNCLAQLHQNLEQRSKSHRH